MIKRKNNISYITAIYHIDKNLSLNDKIIKDSGYARKKILKEKVNNYTHDKYNDVTHTSKSTFNNPIIWIKSFGYWCFNGFKKIQTFWYQLMKKINIVICKKF